MKFVSSSCSWVWPLFVFRRSRRKVCKHHYIGRFDELGFVGTWGQVALTRAKREKYICLCRHFLYKRCTCWKAVRKGKANPVRIPMNHGSMQPSSLGTRLGSMKGQTMNSAQNSGNLFGLNHLGNWSSAWNITVQKICVPSWILEKAWSVNSPRQKCKEVVPSSLWIPEYV